MCNSNKKMSYFCRSIVYRLIFLSCSTEFVVQATVGPGQTPAPSNFVDELCRISTASKSSTDLLRHRHIFAAPSPSHFIPSYSTQSLKNRLQQFNLQLFQLVWSTNRNVCPDRLQSDRPSGQVNLVPSCFREIGRLIKHAVGNSATRRRISRIILLCPVSRKRFKRSINSPGIPQSVVQGRYATPQGFRAFHCDRSIDRSIAPIGRLIGPGAIDLLRWRFVSIVQPLQREVQQAYCQ